jgi:hypothetical protein
MTGCIHHPESSCGQYEGRIIVLFLNVLTSAPEQSSGCQGLFPWGKADHLPPSSAETPVPIE